MKKLTCSIGVIVYNEADNIEKLLKSICKQVTNVAEIIEIIVVSSACTDGTDDIVRAFDDPRVLLIAEPKRRGKSAAINNFLNKATGEILIIESGDTLPAKSTVEKMVRAFRDPKIGMVGGRPVPENSLSTFVGYSVNLLWKLHHRMAMVSPKLGEMIGFRNFVKQIPERSAVDEASIEAIVLAKGFKLKYIPDAIIHNKGPETLSDFIKQRRRIATGHLWLKKTQNYSVVSQNSKLLISLALRELCDHPHRMFHLAGTILLEVYCRMLGWLDFVVLKKNPFTWEIARSTKKLEQRVD